MPDPTTYRARLDRLATEVGPVDGPEATAELLVLAAHDTRDWDTWGGDRAITYWDRLPAKILAACYRGPTLAHWWQAITGTLGCTPPRRIEDRTAVAAALACGDDRAVLDVLRTRPEVICLRVRLAQDLDRQARTKETTR